MSGSEAVALALAGAVAGVVNAIAGGGTLITFPTLILWGTPAVVADATNTFALACGTWGSVYGYRHQIVAIKPWLGRLLPVSLLGGLLGGMLLQQTAEGLFAKMVPFLLLFATGVFVAQGALRRFAGFANSRSRNRPLGVPRLRGLFQRFPSPGRDRANARLSTRPSPHPAARQRVIWAAALFQFFVALYGGYFGAGIGILMLASLGFIGLSDIHEMNGLKTVLGLGINLVAAVYFVVAALIDWPKAGVLTAGMLVGYFCGSHYSQRIPQRYVRVLITAIGFLISGVMFYRQFRL